MIGNSDRFVSAFGRAVLDPEEMAHVVHHAVRNGFAVVLCQPGTKKPVCTLTTPTALARADKAAKAAAKEAGNPRWDKVKHACGLKHALTDPEKARAIYRKVQAQFSEPLNVALEPRQSRMVCVDVDDQGQMHRFLEAWGLAEGFGTEERPLTVKSPGAQNGDGSWAHQGGGHFWFEVPEGAELPTGSGKYVGDGGWVVMWGESYALVPPSQRPEGPYQFESPQVPEVPRWLVQVISEAPERSREGGSGPKAPGDSVDRWAKATPWSVLLGMGPPDMCWTEAGRADRCGCPIWTAPGPHDDPKSATAHEPGCQQYDTSTGHGPLHIWTDNPPAYLAGTSRTMTKLQFLARRDHEGNVAAAMLSQGLEPSLQPVPDALDFDPADVPEEGEEGEWSRFVDLGPYIDGTIVNPLPTLGATREDGVQMLYPSKWHTVIGLTTAGKSWLALWHCLAMIEQGQHVVYIHFEESSPVNTLSRLRQMGADMEMVRTHFHWMSNEKGWRAGEMAFWLDRVDLQPSLVVLDGINAACSMHGWKVSETDAVGLYRAMFVTPCVARGAAVLSLGHPVKDRQRQDEIHSFGSTAWLDEVDGCSFRMVASQHPIRRSHLGSSSVSVVKDRAGEVAALCELSTERSEAWYYLGQFEVNDEEPILDLEGGHATTLVLKSPKPKDDQDEPEPDPVDRLGEQILDALQRFGGRFDNAQHLAEILGAAGVKARTEKVGAALIRLVMDGKIIRPPKPKSGQPWPGWVPES